MGRGVDIGQLDREITLQFKTSGQTASGEPTETWGSDVAVWAKVTPLSGREYYSLLAQQIVADEMLVFRIRWRADARPGAARIRQYLGRDYNIRRVAELRRQQGLDIYADTATA